MMPNTATVTRPDDADIHSPSRYRRNFLYHCLDGVLFIAGMNFVSMNSILPVFIHSLTGSRVAVGLLTTATVVGNSLPQLLAANAGSRYARKKDLVVSKYGWGQRLPWLLMALNAWLVVPRSPLLGLVLFFVFYCIYSTSCGLVIPLWFDVLVKSVPGEKRGTVLGVRWFLSGTASVLAGIVAGKVLGVAEYPLGYALLFFMAFVFTMSSMIFFARIHEPACESKDRPKGLREYLRELPALVRGDSNLVNYLVANAFIGLSGMAGAFYTVHAIDSLGLGLGASGTFASIIMAAQTLSNLAWGGMADRLGYKAVLQSGLVLSAMAALTAVTADTRPAFIVVLALFGASTGAMIFSGLNVITELCPPERRTTYVGLASSLNAPVAGVAPLIGGLLANGLGYGSVFITALVSVALGFIVLTTRVRTVKFSKA